MAGSLIGLLAVQTGDPPEVSWGDEEGGHPGGEEGTKGSVGDEVVLSDVLASIVCADEVVVGTLLVHVDIEAGSVDDEEDGACNESSKEGPEEEASELWSPGETRKESDDAHWFKDDSTDEEGPQGVDSSLFDEGEDDEACTEQLQQLWERDRVKRTRGGVVNDEGRACSAGWNKKKKKWRRR